MRSTFCTFNMVHAITVLTILKMLADAQTTCNRGLGRVVYERLPDQQLQGFDDDVVRDSAPPFRVLEKCQELCLRDRTATNNLVRACTSFDFQPGSRIASFSEAAEYEDSTCYLTREQAQPEGMGNLMMVPNSVHFTEVCLTSNRIERDCPNRRYVFERHPRKKLKLQLTDVKEVTAANRTECEDRCLNEFSIVCRSATYDANSRSCSLSRFTRRTHPDLLEDDPNSDYLENTCLTAERRCDGLTVFIKEEKKRLRGPFEVDIYTNLTLDECQALCLRAEKYFCRSVEFDEQTRQCAISEEDSVSQRDDIGESTSPSYHFYDLVCLDNHPSIARGSEYPDNSASSHLFTDGRRPDTAFQRYRNSRLSGEFHSEITGRSLSECLEECLRQTSFQCRSAVYSEHFHTCRLSRFSQRDGHRIIYDADYDYYENLMHQYLDGERDGASHRPDPLGQDTNFGRPSLGRPVYLDDYEKPYAGGEKGDRFPGKYPLPPGRYPPVHIPIGGERYSGESHRYSFIDHYPPDSGYRLGGRYRPVPERYPSHPERYPLGPDGYPEDRYPGDGYPEDRYPGDGYPGNRFPINRPSVNDNRIPLRGPYYPYTGTYGVERYPLPSNRFPNVPPTRLHPDKSVPPASGFPPDYDSYLMSENPRYPVGNTQHSGRYPAGDRFIDKEVFPKRERYPGFIGKEYPERPPPYYDGPSFSPVRPLPNEGFGEDGIVGGGYIGEGGIYHARPFGTAGPIIGRPPLLARCDEQGNFRRVGQRMRVRKPFVRRYTSAPSVDQCDRECVDARDFVCRSFNYKSFGSAFASDSDNCELSDRDSRDMDINNPVYYDTSSDFDFYEKNDGRQVPSGECLDVTQSCSEDGMEFTLKTPEGFIGRIYTYGYYDRCFFRGNGATINVLRISGAQGYPDCGTQRYGDTMTNIVVVQFSDYVQTARDKSFNLTCLFRGPDETVVTSGYIGAGRSGAPIPIEYLPAENTLNNRVRLLILYQGRPTTTIAVGDPLTFRLEANDGSIYSADIFATNVVARDPYSGRNVQLIDRYGCPVDNYVFPGLDRLRDTDSLEARFNAFKIPESNFLVFEATVRTCANGCQPAYCSSSGSAGRSEPSFGRKRRDLEYVLISNKNETKENVTVLSLLLDDTNNKNKTDALVEEGEEEYVRKMIEVFASRMDMDVEENSLIEKQKITVEKICVTSNEYYGLITAVIVLVVFLACVVILSILAYWWNDNSMMIKHRNIDRSNNHSRNQDDSYSTKSVNFSFLRPGLQKNTPSSTLNSIMTQGAMPLGSHTSIAGIVSNQRSNLDPSEPIYTDPSLFEFGRSALIGPKAMRNDNVQIM
ncbi:uncharacterized protein LOC117181378 isoform X2 [Belonocnema kinseyi]|uniref:uncharacterized protein LOC117181378 isoform X2 n=1 Tax=Belonocnema kinseyi TaxID=2817044 RepID=UPI00143CF4DF|nr:uncharacterized protein LOC117181378 isoform X2 [Belonocnema kinseyi]